MEFVQHELEEPTGLENYSSVKDFAPQVRATFVEEVQLGMVEGPLTKQQAALRCNCREEDLCPGPPLQPLTRGTRYAPSMMDPPVGPTFTSRTRQGRRLQPPQCWIVSKHSTGYMRQAAHNHPLSLTCGTNPLEHSSGNGPNPNNTGFCSRLMSPRHTEE